MKIEKRPNSAFISHSGLTVFFNKTLKGYTIRATERTQDGKWRLAGEMEVSTQDYDSLLKLLGELKR